MGIKASRCEWLIGWMSKIVSEKVVHVGRFAEGLGRAAFVFGALEYERPVLAPLYSFVALHSRDSITTVPLFVLVVLEYLMGQLRRRRY